MIALFQLLACTQTVAKPPLATTWERDGLSIRLHNPPAGTTLTEQGVTTLVRELTTGTTETLVVRTSAPKVLPYADATYLDIQAGTEHWTLPALHHVPLVHGAPEVGLAVSDKGYHTYVNDGEEQVDAVRLPAFPLHHYLHEDPLHTVEPFVPTATYFLRLQGINAKTVVKIAGQEPITFEASTWGSQGIPLFSLLPNGKSDIVFETEPKGADGLVNASVFDLHNSSSRPWARRLPEGLFTLTIEQPDTTKLPPPPLLPTSMKHYPRPKGVESLPTLRGFDNDTVSVDGWGTQMIGSNLTMKTEINGMRDSSLEAGAGTNTNVGQAHYSLIRDGDNHVTVQMTATGPEPMGKLVIKDGDTILGTLSYDPKGPKKQTLSTIVPWSTDIQHPWEQGDPINQEDPTTQAAIKAKIRKLHKLLKKGDAQGFVRENWWTFDRAQTSAPHVPWVQAEPWIMLHEVEALADHGGLAPLPKLDQPYPTYGVEQRLVVAHGERHLLRSVDGEITFPTALGMWNGSIEVMP